MFYPVFGVWVASKRIYYNVCHEKNARFSFSFIFQFDPLTLHFLQVVLKCNTVCHNIPRSRSSDLTRWSPVADGLLLNISVILTARGSDAHLSSTGCSAYSVCSHYSEDLPFLDTFVGFRISFIPIKIWRTDKTSLQYTHKHYLPMNPQSFCVWQCVLSICHAGCPQRDASSTACHIVCMLVCVFRGRLHYYFPTSLDILLLQ